MTLLKFRKKVIQDRGLHIM